MPTSPSQIDAPLAINMPRIVSTKEWEAAREQMRKQALESSRFQDFVGSSEPMRLVYDAIQQVADSGAATVEKLGGALRRTLAAIEPYLMQLDLERR